ncbi:SMI1/KNR4 family protein [Riemerella anatipestifer]|nr:SMI1/KNR4 family protein [Riemerella anatipestifer]
MNTQYPNIPKDYIDYLLEIGAGVIREIQFDVKGFLFDFSDLGLEEIFYVDEKIKFFGDDLSGNFAGFDLSKENTDEVIEFWHDSNEIYYTGKTFREFIREKMLMFDY